MKLSTKTIVVVIITLAFGVGLLLHRSYRGAREKSRADYLHEQEIKLERKASELETLFTLLYQGGRTISLLPGIRSLHGKNLPENSGGQFDGRRFSAAAQLTVQQIYNNLADNIAISEIYCILKGFRPEGGETPFFMYDSLVIQREIGAEVETGAAGAVNSDFPEEYEGAEYEHYVRQLAFFEENYPRFTFRSLKEIPFIVSSAMRTCDNTQYYSKSTGEVQESYGLLFSVPIYSEAGDFVGIISTVIRRNVFEAELLEVPFVIVTERDRVAAKEAGFAMPEEHSAFVLRNEAWGLTLFDRRNESLLEGIAELYGVEKKEELVLETSLRVATRSDWQLRYLVSQEALAERLRPIWYVFLTELAAVFLLALSVISIYLNVARQRSELGIILSHMRRLALGDVSGETTFEGTGIMAQLAKTYAEIVQSQSAKAENAVTISKGDLSCAIQINSERDVVGLSLQKMVQELGAMIRQIKGDSSLIVASLEGISEISTVLAQSSEEIGESSREASRAAGDISKTIQTVTLETEKMSVSVKDVGEKAMEGAKVTEQALEVAQQTFSTIESLKTSVSQISAVTDEISRIADQTNLLALNATIEAARAGETGKGFAVVANEVKELAHQSGQAADNIKHRIELIQQDTDRAVQAIGKMSEIINQVRHFSSLIHTAVAEQILASQDISTNLSASSLGVDEVAQKVELVSQGVVSGSEGMQKIKSSAQELLQRSALLQQLVDNFKV